MRSSEERIFLLKKYEEMCFDLHVLNQTVDWLVKVAQWKERHKASTAEPKLEKAYRREYNIGHRLMVFAGLYAPSIIDKITSINKQNAGFAKSYYSGCSDVALKVEGDTLAVEIEMALMSIFKLSAAL